MNDSKALLVVASYLQAAAELWWDKIQNTRQQHDKSVNNFVYKLRELFTLVKIDNESFKIHSLLQAIDPQVAYELEQRDNMPKTFESVSEKARKLELVKSKYACNLVDWQLVIFGSSTSDDSNVSTLQDLVKEFKTLKVHVVKQPRSFFQTHTQSQPTSLGHSSGHSQGQFSQPQVKAKLKGVCWKCRSEDHMSNTCPQKNEQEKGSSQQQPSTRKKGKAVEIPIGPPLLLAMEGVERSDVSLVPPDYSIVPPGSSMGPSGVSMVSPGRSMTLYDISPVPPGTSMVPPGWSAVSHGVGLTPPVVKRKRKLSHSLPVEFCWKDFWFQLKELDAGLSMADWVALDRSLGRDMRYELYYLYNDEEDSLDEVLEGSESENSDYLSDEGSFGTGTSDSKGYASNNTIYHYPYSHRIMSNSKPLKESVVINGQVVQAIFDSRASVSIISKKLANKLNLQANGNQILISALHKESCGPFEITTDVSIQIIGKLRPEHMCILNNNTE
ncbi:CCHC-type zinc finger transcription factor [Phycomyces blakesleeanus NRRL 1555(-)]|uniref:CCHC-type zinc finger transcription factor n=1 Tax=Phycomyces blakesleeanus (strain ATCC 8743b / DSM 1359 / FGSC 10004 / NBRC 33097 / NRRL 1555) TaxID=763407 RepID=A0A163CSL9_PHYB8|nr:CCHC-type zinc finger transcription factor [Phycomyces blakesleeanus NRRL 1555(-)]OAD65320.1 CCHC-type zinc finger transcription factor [Phycomyces blakesleeanus NRRL 1555(-)]|eukprot:XP_018283360.1 CCHC-type zinc finger transcription factor [Phycomyces blakesleeanus NRRL 1555(-)]